MRRHLILTIYPRAMHNPRVSQEAKERAQHELEIYESESASSEQEAQPSPSNVKRGLKA